MRALRCGRVGERVLGLVGGCTLVLGMATFDTNVRAYVVGALGGELSSDLGVAGARAQRFAGVLTEAVGSYSADHGVLVPFAIGAVVLLVVMLRI